MSLGLVRGLFFVAALSVSALAAASWYEPGPGVISSNGRSYCLSPALKPLTPASVQANQNLLLLVMGLSQGMR
ncbi:MULTISPECIES: hypothetical protein [Pseudomonas]|jgi:hypothetical protein|uniref:Uncharacterized protein n=1 Tax=Phytopseudomonas punonensis TaxID=1220495 RepID=A0A1M6XNT8_9GAMM|nr:MULTISPECIES: hypothetical protein [Pseudomonas]MBD9653973.1 hypothetical protein [Pseudomonas sp. PDM12]PZW49479.1 hypothetical protein F469_00278 [Pseudomonas sp. URMO17WK12:I2]SHL07680.1 hypothetical protein SAMN05216288_0986 [Pseudomonas punonensis]